LKGLWGDLQSFFIEVITDSQYNRFIDRIKGLNIMKKRYVSCILIILLFALCFPGVSIKNKVSKSNDIKKFTAFFNMTGEERDGNNDIKQKIAELTGAECDESWISGQSKEDAVNYFIANGDYPDFISGGQELYQAGALIPIDEYWKDYPNIYSYMSQDNWDKLRLSDGHIYWIPQFGVGNRDDTETIHEGEAFWIQTRVLKWAGYPKIQTMDEYFNLIEKYVASNPAMPNGTRNIPYTILCDDWKYFCLENVPQFLDGYPNDGSCVVDPKTQQVLDYNTTPTARRYFAKLNEEYKKGIVDPESFTSTYDEYIAKLSTGAVLGMVDQWWDFSDYINTAYERQNLEDQGCNYVPLPLTISKDIQNQWHVKRSDELDTSAGLSVTTSCKDVAGALKFINDLLDPKVQNLRFWGTKGQDYEVDKKGLFFRTAEQRKRQDNQNLQASHFCMYSYFPRREGLSTDGINAFSPQYQPDEFFASLPSDVRTCFLAYGCKNYVDMIGTNDPPGKWYPMYSYSTQLTYATEPGRVWKDMGEIKHQWLPQVVMANDFEHTWDAYMGAYKACRPEIFLADMQNEVNRRIK
jgi:putative aldouronate transport system substrate-binding protein